MEEARLSELRDVIPHDVTLVAVSKFHPAEAVRAAYDAGQRVFGESRADELAAKAAALPDDICWHFIGHVQTNKLRRILPHVEMIQSVDSEKLLRLIDAEAVKMGLHTKVLLQVH
ncbi:MAG: alanine racemase, partial [Muribaculaceae bacterium]|nr:alanine racemase [Muribaculaceae bacterium]